MFERFTEKVIKVIVVAQEEARRLSHNVVGTEQILLGLVGEGTGIAAKVLKSAGVNMKNAHIEVEKIVGRGSVFIPVEIPFSSRAKHVLELSLEEARKLEGLALNIALGDVPKTLKGKKVCQNDFCFANFFKLPLGVVSTLKSSGPGDIQSNDFLGYECYNLQHLQL